MPKDRIQRLERGVNVCRWFRKPPEHSDAFYLNHITDEEMESMRKLGLRHVRLGIGPPEIFGDGYGTLDVLKAGFIDKAIARFLKHDIAVVVDLHNEDRSYVEGKSEGERLVANWVAFAKHLSKTDPNRVFLELVNEPVFGGKEQDWFALQRQLVREVRKVAPKHTLILTGPNWGGPAGLAKLVPVDDDNVVYSFHFYEPYVFTHQGATWAGPTYRPLRGVPYPSDPEQIEPLLEGLPKGSREALEQYGSDRWDATLLKEKFSVATDWGKRHGVPLYCGEFAVLPKFAKPEPMANWYRDMGDLLDESKVGWAVWGWDEPFGLRKEGTDKSLKVDPVVAGNLGLRLR